MSQHGLHVAAVLAKAAVGFRQRQAKAAEELDEIARERDHRGIGTKKAAGGGQKRATTAKSASRRQGTGASASESGATASGGPGGAAGGDWKASAALGPKGTLPIGAKIKVTVCWCPLARQAVGVGFMGDFFLAGAWSQLLEARLCFCCLPLHLLVGRLLCSTRCPPSWVQRVLDFLRGCDQPQTARQIGTGTQL